MTRATEQNLSLLYTPHVELEIFLKALLVPLSVGRKNGSYRS